MTLIDMGECKLTHIYYALLQLRTQKFAWSHFLYVSELYLSSFRSKLDCSYPFPTDLAPIGIANIAKSISKVLSQFNLGLY